MIKVGLNFALTAMERDNLNCWILLDGARELDRQDDKSAPIAQSLDALRNAVEGMRGDTLTIKATKEGAKAALKTFFVDLSAGSSGVGAKSLVNGLGSVPNSVWDQLAELKAKIAVQEATAHLQKQLDELNQKSISGWDDKIGAWVDRLAPHFAPHLAPHISRLFGGVPPVANMAGVEHGTNEERLTQALKVWFEADPDALPLIERIARIAQDEPAKYRCYKPMLL